MSDFLKPDTPLRAVVSGAPTYERVAASDTDEDTTFNYLHRLTIVPATTTPGAVSIKDGAGGDAISIFVGGTVDVKPITVELGIKAANTWLITTGANVSVIASGSVV